MINVGTPESPERNAVRGFLREFLSDPRVVDLPKIQRFLLLHLFILPFRPKRVAPKYRRIWMDRGSPLAVHSRKLAQETARKLGNGYAVEAAMRYGRPSIESGLKRLFSQKIDRLIAVPLMPQYASATTGTIVEKILVTMQNRPYLPEIKIIGAFYDHPAYLKSMAEVGRRYWERKPDHVLFSFHGLPKRQLAGDGGLNGSCLAEGECCDEISDGNYTCYRAQCFAAARKLAQALEIPDRMYSVAFQSRLGRTEWIAPYTNETIGELARNGIERLVVFCPSFVTDCLETLEEIGMEGESLFRRHGGKHLILVPSLNAEPVWVDALTAMISE